MANFTPQEIEEMLREFFDVVGKRQYTGARYVPIFGRKDASSIEWDNTAPYEPLTIVLHQGNSYTSRTYVPVGVDITNTNYWANTGNYNAQIEQYRQEVMDIADEMTDLREDWRETKEELEDMVPRKRIALYFGNSYTDGFGSHDNYTGFRLLTMYLFDENYHYTASGCSFAAYSDHPTTYSDLVENAIADTAFSNNDVTDIIVTSAIGDTRAVCENHEADVQSGIVSFCNRCRQAFPKAKIYIHFAELVYGRSAQGTYSNKYWMAQLRVHYILKRLSYANGYAYLGWTGWNVNNTPGYNYTDNYHPNDNGYRAIVSAFMSAWHGGSPYLAEKYMTFGPASDPNYAFVRVQQESPETAIIKIKEETIPFSELDAGIGSEVVNTIGTMVNANWLPIAYGFCPPSLVMVRTSSGSYWPATIYTEIDSSGNCTVKMKFALETPTSTPTGVIVVSNPIYCKFRVSETLSMIYQ